MKVVLLRGYSKIRRFKQEPNQLTPIITSVSDVYQAIKQKIGDVQVAVSDIKQLTGFCSSLYDKTKNNTDAYLVTGLGVLVKENGLIVVDCDTEESYIVFSQLFPHLTDTFTVKTKRGYHLYYKLIGKAVIGVEGYNEDPIEAVMKAYNIQPGEIIYNSDGSAYIKDDSNNGHEVDDGISNQKFEWEYEENGNKVKIHIDIRASKNSYVVAPGSRIKTDDGQIFVYEPVKDLPVKEIIASYYYEIVSILKTIESEKNHKVYTEEIKNNKKTDKTDKTDREDSIKYLSRLGKREKEIFEKLINTISKHYVVGRRHLISLYLAGLLLKQGYEPEKVSSVIYELARKNGDNEASMRLANVKSTIKKLEKKEEVKGYEGLKELLSNKDFNEVINLLNINNNNSNNSNNGTQRRNSEPIVLKVKKNREVDISEMKPSDIQWVVEREGKKVWAYIPTEDGQYEKKLVSVGGFIEFGILEENNIKWFLKTNTGIKIINDNTDARRYITVLNKILWEYYKDYQEENGKIYMKGVVGWNRNEKTGKWQWVCGDSDDYWWNDDERYTPASDEEYEQQIQNFVDYLSRYEVAPKTTFAMIWGFGSYFNDHPNEKLRTKPSFLSITGFSGKGKTSIAALLSSLWHKEGRINSAASTITGLEITAKRFGNQVVVIDEITNSSIEKIKDIIYLFSTGAGKTRGTKNLLTNQTRITGNFVFTGEFDPLVFSNLAGLDRRVITIELLHEEYDFWNLYNMKKKLGGFYQKLAQDLTRWLENEENVEKVRLAVDYILANLYRKDVLEVNYLQSLITIYLYLQEQGFSLPPLAGLLHTSLEILSEHQKEFVKKLDTETLLKDAIVDIMWSEDYGARIEEDSIKRVFKAAKKEALVMTYVKHNEPKEVYILRTKSKKLAALKELHRGIWKVAVENEWVAITRKSIEQMGIKNVYSVNMEWFLKKEKEEEEVSKETIELKNVIDIVENLMEMGIVGGSIENGNGKEGKI